MRRSGAFFVLAAPTAPPSPTAAARHAAPAVHLVAAPLLCGAGLTTFNPATTEAFRRSISEPYSRRRAHTPRVAITRKRSAKSWQAVWTGRSAPPSKACRADAVVRGCSAAQQGRHPDELVQDVLAQYFDEEARFVAAVKRGDASLRQGEYLTHEAVGERLHRFLQPS